MIRSDRPTWDHQFAETESERNARLRAKRLTMNETNEHNHTTQDEQPVTITAERYRQYQDAEAERDQLRAYIASQREALAAIMMRQSLATGHGDTIGDLLAELEPQIKQLRDRLEAARAYAKHERDLGAEECALADAQTTKPCGTTSRKPSRR